MKKKDDQKRDRDNQSCARDKCEERNSRQFMENPKMPYSEAKHMLVIIGRNNDFQKVFLM